MSMTKTDKQALREAANAANIASFGRWEAYKPHKGARGYEVKVGVNAVAQHCLKVHAAFIAAANPQFVLALLDELEAKDIVRSAQDYQFDQQADRIAELENELGHANARNDAKCAELCKQDEEIGALRHRIAELEARTLTVKMPQGYVIRPGHPINESRRGGMIPKDGGEWLSRIDVEIAAHAAGIALDTGE